jgi:hypothetical protein
MKLGRLIIETYKNCQGNRIFSVIILNKSGGSMGYTDTSILNVFLWLTYINRI